MKPIRSNVLLRRLPPATRWGEASEVSQDTFKTSELMIELPSTLTYDSWECEVLAVGPGEVFPDGSRECMGVQPGDRVLVPQSTGTRVSAPNEPEVFLTDISGIEAVIQR